MKKERRQKSCTSFYNIILQQEAARKLNFRARKTMMLAQQLYEGINLGKEGNVGLITYMRTDSTRIADSAKEEAKSYIETAMGKSMHLLRSQSAKSNAKSQDAHEAIRPTSVDRPPSSMKTVLSRDQLRLYKLIWERFVASQMAPAVL